jgi:hypothetical protein
MNVISDSNYKPTKAESDGAGYTKTLNSLSSLYLLFIITNQALLLQTLLLMTFIAMSINKNLEQVDSCEFDHTCKALKISFETSFSGLGEAGFSMVRLRTIAKQRELFSSIESLSQSSSSSSNDEVFHWISVSNILLDQDRCILNDQ